MNASIPVLPDPYSNLYAVANLVSAADKIPYFTNLGAAALADFTAVARTLLAATTQAQQRTALGIDSLPSLNVVGDAVIGGNLTVNGTTVTVNVDTLNVEDPLIKVSKSNTLDITDLGLYGLYQPASTPTYSGIFRDATDGKWKLFTGLQEEPTTTVNTSGTGYTVGTLVANLEGAHNGTVGANTPASGAFTGLSTTGDATIGGNIGLGGTAPGTRLDLGVQAPGLDTAINWLRTTTASSDWRAHLASIYDANQVHHYLVLNGTLSGSLASPTATGSPVGGGYFAHNSANARIELGTFGAGSGQALTPRFVITTAGLAGINKITGLTAQLEVVSSGASVPALRITGAVSQSANLTEWRNSAGVAGATVNAARSFTNTFGGIASEFFGASAGTHASNTGVDNVGFGYLALQLNTSGSYNAAFGAYALAANTTGQYNIAVGRIAMQSNTTGEGNTAVGYAAINATTIGSYNAAVGMQALASNTTGSYNNAFGYQALFSNTTGTYNTASGLLAMFSNTTGYENASHGYRALYGNTTGYYNTAMGVYALNANTTGHSNAAVGYGSLFSNTTGLGNVAVGFNALITNTTANYNVAVGDSALYLNDTD